MSKAMDKHELRKYLAAFADGELDVEQNLRVLDSIKMDPDAAARVAHQHELRVAVDRTLRGMTPATPAALRERLERVLAEPTGPAEQQSADVAGRIGARPPYRRLWQAASIAAVLAVGAFVVTSARQHLGLPPAGPSFVQSVEAETIIPTAQVNTFARKHLNCAQVIERLRTFEDSPHEISEVPGFISLKLGRTGYDMLDLSGIGYEFLKIGPCRIPGTQSTHLIYKSTPQTGRNDALSLWIAPDDGSLKIAEDTMYKIRGADCAHPLVVWRHAGMAYYLIGDSYPSVHQAYQTLASAR